MTKHWKTSSLTLAACIASVVIESASAASEPTDTKSTPPEVSPSASEAPAADATESRFEALFKARSPDPIVSADPLDPRASTALFVPSAASYTARRPAEDPTIPNHPALHDRFYIGLGAFFSTSSTEAQLNSNTGIGTNLDLENLLGLDESKVSPQGLARWRFSERWRLELEYFELDRSNTRAIGQDINWGDQTFPIGTTIDTTFNVAVTRFSVGYSFYKRPDKELGLALGFHITDITAELKGGGGNADKGDVLAPLPVLSMYGQFALTDEWAIAGRIDAFKLEYDPYRGHVYSLGVDALWQPFRHVGFGIGWRSLDLEVEAEKESFNGRVRSSYSGPIAFIAASF